MKQKRIIIIVVITLSIFLLTFSSIGIIYLIKDNKIKNAKVEVVLVEDLTADFASEKKISDYITSINGTIQTDSKIDSTKLGKKKVKFRFKNDENIIVPYEFEIEVVDKEAPLIWLGNSYTIKKGNDTDLTKKILCGDNYDSKPNCYIKGEYDPYSIGSYPLIFEAIDSSGNKSTQSFILHVVEETPSSTDQNEEQNYTYFKDVVNEHKKENVQIGIDVSHWQEEIDFAKVKQAGVEFVMIKVGGTRGTNGEYYVDENFVRNIKEANKHNIDVGVYFYSYSNSKEDAIKDAKWLLEQIKDYKISLPIAFDWEDWTYFNEYNLSFFELTEMANAFLNTVEDAGYKGILYSSKSYLENIWMKTEHDIWLAHYTNKTNYKGDYMFWQLCSDGKIDGIKGVVDINIMYKNK